MRFAEIEAELQVGDSVESPLGVNDRLDVEVKRPLEGPMFEWPEELLGSLPEGLLLTLEESGKRQTLSSSRGQAAGDFRRFVFHRLEGAGPCTLTAKLGRRELTLLSEQPLSDPTRSIQWGHWLEDFLVVPTVEGESDEPQLEQVPAPLTGRV